LNGWQLKSPKNGTQFLTAGSFSPHPLRPSFSQRFLSFFSDPSVAYLLLIFGGLCFWLELSHPGLIFPGVVGAFCLLTALISFQMLPIRVGALGLIFLGLGLLTAELFLPTFGLLGLAGIGSFIFGSLFLMEPSAADIALSLKIILPSAAVLSVAVLLLARAVWKGQKQRLRSGLGALVGELGETREAISADGGLILIHGELWRAVAPASENISVGTIVVVTEVKNMLLVVRPNLTKE
jgi:membrane-bound serine protease (ClpP class)